MSACVERPYSSAAVCQAAGLSRATFDAWLLRHYLPLPPGPGTGRERRFSANEAILVAIAAQLTKSRLSITAAGHAVEFLNGDTDGLWPRAQFEANWLLVIAQSSAPAKVDAPTSSIHAALVRLESLLDLERTIEDWDFSVMVIVKVSTIARRTLNRLAAPAPMTAASPAPDTKRITRIRIAK